MILLPLLLALSWGRHFADEVYTLLRYGRTFAAGAGITQAVVTDLSTPALVAPLFALLVSLPTRLGIDPAWVAAILSAIGWSVAAFAFLAIGRTLQRPHGSLVAALLLSFNPTIITTLGSPASWVVALSWLIIAFLLKRAFLPAIITFLLLATLFIQWPPTVEWSSLDQYGGAMAWSVFLFAAGIGSDWLAQQLATQDIVRLTYPQTSTALLGTIFILIGSFQGIRLWKFYQERPVTLWQLEEDVAAWLRKESTPTAALLTSQKIGYLAGRPTANLPDLSQPGAASTIRNLLQSQPVDYLVTANNLPWQQLEELIWFRLAYQPIQQFNAPSLSSAPFTVWAYRQPLGDLGERHSINARVPDRFRILGYQIGPGQIQPGESVNMALILQAPQATTVSPVPFQAIVRLISPVDNSTVTEWIVDLPQSISPTDWEPNEVIIEQFPLAMPVDLEAGAYQFNLSLFGPDSPDLWPFSLDNDINRLDRIPIGDIIAPWEGDLEDVHPHEAIFDKEINLVGYAPIKTETDGVLDVTLYWQVGQAVDEDYVVFVHMLDENGQLLANHDSQPNNGRFPTSAWQPGSTIPDTHTILLPPDLPAAEYQLKAGLYAPETGERLPLTAADGSAAGDSATLLTTITLP